MSYSTKIFGWVRKLYAQDYAEGEGQLAINTRGDLSVVQGLPPRAELVRLGKSWNASIPTGSAFAPVAAWPTTLANIILYNGEPAGGKTYVIDRAWAAAITTIAAASSFALLAQNVGNQPTVAAPANNAAVLKTSSNCRNNYDGNARLAIANSAFAIASQWDVIAAMAASPSASIGASTYADLYGAYVVPPGGVFCLNVVASTAAGTMIQGLSWHEVQLPIVP